MGEEMILEMGIFMFYFFWGAEVEDLKGLVLLNFYGMLKWDLIRSLQLVPLVFMKMVSC